MTTFFSSSSELLSSSDELVSAFLVVETSFLATAIAEAGDFSIFLGFGFSSSSSDELSSEDDSDEDDDSLDFAFPIQGKIISINF